MKKVFIIILGCYTLFVIVYFLYVTNKIRTSNYFAICWQNNLMRIELGESAMYIKEIKVLSDSNSDTLIIVPYVTSTFSIFYGELSGNAILSVGKNVKYLKLVNDTKTYDLNKDIKRCWD